MFQFFDFLVDNYLRTIPAQFLHNSFIINLNYKGDANDAHDVTTEDVNVVPDVVMKQYADVGSETQAMAKVTLECGLQVNYNCPAFVTITVLKPQRSNLAACGSY